MKKQIAHRLLGFVQGLAAFVYVLALFSVSQAQQTVTPDEFVLTDTGKTALEELKKENLFALGGTGYAGATSKGEKSLDILIQEREADTALYKLAQMSSGAGGLYALFGLRLLKSANYQDAYKRFLQLEDQPERKGSLFGRKLGAGIVERMDGCLFSWQHRLDVAKEIDSGKFDAWIDVKDRLRQAERGKRQKGSRQVIEGKED